MEHGCDRRELPTNFGRRSKGKRQLGRHRPRWDDNIKVRCVDVNWINLDEGRVQWWALVNTEIKSCVS
jgi:hypothetical protein